MYCYGEITCTQYICRMWGICWEWCISDKHHRCCCGSKLLSKNNNSNDNDNDAQSICRLSCLLTSCVRWIPWCFSAQNICICPYLLIVACTTPQSFQVPTYRFHPVYIWGSCMRWRACITGLHWGKKIQIGHLTSGLEVFNCPLLIAPSKQTSGSCWYSLIISALTCRHKF